MSVGKFVIIKISDCAFLCGEVATVKTFFSSFCGRELIGHCQTVCFSLRGVGHCQTVCFSLRGVSHCETVCFSLWGIGCCETVLFFVGSWSLSNCLLFFIGSWSLSNCLLFFVGSWSLSNCLLFFVGSWPLSNCLLFFVGSWPLSDCLLFFVGSWPLSNCLLFFVGSWPLSSCTFTCCPTVLSSGWSWSLSNCAFACSELIAVKLYFCCWSLLYSAILRSWTDSLCSHVILHEWIAFYSMFLNIHQSGVLTALAWLVPHEIDAVSAQVLCTLYNCAPCHFTQCHIHLGACVFSCNLPPALLAEWPGSFMCYCSKTGVERILKWVSTENWSWRRKFSHCSCRDSNPRPFDHESGALTFLWGELVAVKLYFSLGWIGHCQNCAFLCVDFVTIRVSFNPVMLNLLLLLRLLRVFI